MSDFKESPTFCNWRAYCTEHQAQDLILRAGELHKRMNSQPRQDSDFIVPIRTKWVLETLAGDMWVDALKNLEYTGATGGSPPHVRV